MMATTHHMLFYGYVPWKDWKDLLRLLRLPPAHPGKTRAVVKKIISAQVEGNLDVFRSILWSIMDVIQCYKYVVH